MEQENKICALCAESIPAIAKKCNHCGAFQDWRRYFDIGGYTVPILISALSLIALISSNAKSIYYFIESVSEKSGYNLSILDLQPEKLQIYFENLSNQNLIMKHGALCRVPLVKEEILKQKSGLELGWGYPKKGEIEDNIMSVYTAGGDETGGRFELMEPGEKGIFSFYVHQRRPEKSYDFFLDEDTKDIEIPSYCFFQVETADDRELHSFIKASAADLWALQNIYRREPKYGYPSEAGE